MTIPRVVACIAFACALSAIPAGAQRATTIAPPVPGAFVAHAHAGVTVTAQGNTYTGDIQLAMAQRGNLVRVDVLSVKSDQMPLPPVSATAVIDRDGRSLTLWSDVTKLYYTQPFVLRIGPAATPSPSSSPTPPPATPRPRTSPSPARRQMSPLANLDVLDLTLKLIGHATTAGVASTGLAFDLQVRRKNETATSHVSATTQLADEFAFFPLALDVSIEPGAMPFRGRLSYAVDDLTRTLPPAARFTVPAGYARASSLLGVLFPSQPWHAVASPSASPAP